MVTVTELGWSGIQNGELLALAEADFDVFLSVDQNLKYQQNLKSFKIGLILLVARSNSYKALAPLMSKVQGVLDTIKRGDFVQIGDS